MPVYLVCKIIHLALVIIFIDLVKFYLNEKIRILLCYSDLLQFF